MEVLRRHNVNVCKSPLYVVILAVSKPAKCRLMFQPASTLAR